MKYNTPFDAACALYRSGHTWNPDYERFERGSWYAYMTVQKNGKCRVVSR